MVFKFIQSDTTSLLIYSILSGNVIVANPVDSTLLGISTVSSPFYSEKTNPTISFVPS